MADLVAMPTAEQASQLISLKKRLEEVAAKNVGLGTLCNEYTLILQQTLHGSFEASRPEHFSFFLVSEDGDTSSEGSCIEYDDTEHLFAVSQDGDTCCEHSCIEYGDTEHIKEQDTRTSKHYPLTTRNLRRHDNALRAQAWSNLQESNRLRHELDSGRRPCVVAETLAMLSCSPLQLQLSLQEAPKCHHVDEGPHHVDEWKCSLLPAKIIMSSRYLQLC